MKNQETPNKQQLKNMVNHVINGETKEATKDLNDYLAAKMKQVSGLKEEENDEDAEGPNTFWFVAEDTSATDAEHTESFEGMISKKESYKWEESTVAGNPPHNYGNETYMGYLKPQEIIYWIERDYGQNFEIYGPYFTQEEADARFEDVSFG